MDEAMAAKKFRNKSFVEISRTTHSTAKSGNL
jgi:hypothetical protein